MDPNIYNQLKSLDIKAITLNKDLGRLNFESVSDLVEKFKDTLIELYDLNYGNLLSENEIAQINGVTHQFLAYINQLQNFDIGQADSQTVHDNLQSTIINYYNSSIASLRPFLTFLRQEADKVSDKADLRAQVREASMAKKEYEELAAQFKSQIETLNKKKDEVSAKHGEVAARTLAVYFHEEAEKNKGEATSWLAKRNYFYRTLMAQIMTNLCLYLAVFILGDKLNLWNLYTKELFTIQYAFINFSLLSLLSYGLIFASKNYNIRENLSSINNHRKNVAMTLEDFLATRPEQEVAFQMIRQGTEAMFKHFPLGFVNKNDGAKDAGPILEVINPVQRINNQS